MKDKLKDNLGERHTGQKRNLVLLAMATVVLAFSLAGYLFKTRDGGTVLEKSAQKKEGKLPGRRAPGKIRLPRRPKRDRQDRGEALASPEGTVRNQGREGEGRPRRIEATPSAVRSRPIHQK